MSIARKKNKYRTKTSEHRDRPPSVSTPTKKQMEVLTLLLDGNNHTRISILLNKAKSTVTGHLRLLRKKGYTKKENSCWKPTSKAKNSNFKSSVGSSLVDKNIHANKYDCRIIEVPNYWNKDIFEKSILKGWYQENQKCYYIKTEIATIKIYISTMNVEFFIRIGYAKTLDEIKSIIWNRFTESYEKLEEIGFKLGTKIKAKDPEFANPNGFFATIANKITKSGMDIEVDGKKFWIDFSEAVAEEETDDEETAKRMENLARSAIRSRSDFEDLDNVKEIVKELSFTTQNMVHMHQNSTQVKTSEKPDPRVTDYFG